MIAKLVSVCRRAFCVIAVSAFLAVSPPRAFAAPSREFNIVPIAGGDSDVGLGFGEVSDVASLRPGQPGYWWKVESGAFITFKLRDGDIINPYQDYYLLWTLPNLTASERLRLEVRPAYTNESTLKYYGIGNASPLPSATSPVEDAEYQRMHPTLSVEARYRVFEHFYVMLGSVYTHNWLTVRPTTILGQQQAAGPAEVRAILGNFDSHGVELLEAEAQLDTRDSETVTEHGQFHTVLLRLSPHLGSSLPYGYERLTLTSRFYGTVVRRWLSVSFRLVGDVLEGSPPFYELARFDETPAIGGGKAVRGVPAQRYYGKVKLFENFEVRSELLPFTFRHKPMVLGVAAFVDGGRSWTELGHSHPELDGGGLGLKYGIGGGLRLQQGKTFVVRADVAWSPDAQPIGAYFAAGEIF
jgi:hypothetical protein